MHEVTITADRRLTVGIIELARSWELLLFLAKRQIQVSYQQSLLGVGWVILQPLLSMVVFTFIFGRLAKLPSDGLPYAVFYVVGQVPFRYMASSISMATGSLVGNKALVTKVYLPRMVLPLAPAISGLLTFAIGLAVVVVVMLVYGITPAASVAQLPFWIALMILLCLGVGLWTSAANAIFRDVSFIVGYLLQLLLFASPVTYSTDLIPEHYRTLFLLNPFAATIAGFRAALTGTPGPPGWIVAVASGVIMLLVVSGAAFFHRVESAVADAV